MKKFGILFLIAGCLLYVTSCKKETVYVVDFSQVTDVDSNCRITGGINPNEWGSDSVWSQTELSLVSFIDSNTLSFDSAACLATVYPACPNPSDGLFQVTSFAEGPCEMRVACVNTNYEILYINSYRLSGGLSNQQYDFSSLTAFHRANFYRFYYAFFTSRDSLFYKGHGDFYIR